MSWQEVKVSDIAEVIGGGTPPTQVDEYWNGDIPWITPKDLSNYENRYISRGERNITKTGLSKSSARLLPKNTILVSSRAPIGYVAIAENELCTNQGFKSLILNDGYSPQFLYYLLKKSKPLLESRASGATFKELSASKFKEISLKIPKIKTQERIASTLSAYDDLIENNRRRIQLLEESARLLYREWFVSFRFPGHEHVEIVDGLPQGWKEVKFEDTSLKFIDGDRGKNYPNHSEFCHNGYCLFLSAKNVTSDDKFNFSNELMFITKEKDSILRSGKLKRGDLVLTTRGTVGNIAYYDDSINFENIRINSGMVILRDFEDDFESYYLYVTLRSLSFKDQIKNFTSGTAQPQLPIRDLKKMKILKPSSKIMKNYCAVLKSSSLQIQNLELQNQKLKEARDILLPRLMSGEIAV